MATIEKVSCFPNEGTPEVIAGDPVDGDLVRITSGTVIIYQRYTVPVAPTPQPRVLSKTEFNKYGWAQLGMAAFQKVIEDTRNSTGTTDADYEARSAVTQYDAAITVAKSEVEAIGFKIKAAGFMTQEQFDDMTGDNWPTA